MKSGFSVSAGPRGSRVCRLPPRVLPATRFSLKGEFRLDWRTWRLLRARPQKPARKGSVGLPTANGSRKDTRTAAPEDHFFQEQILFTYILTLFIYLLSTRCRPWTASSRKCKDAYKDVGIVSSKHERKSKKRCEESLHEDRMARNKIKAKGE